MAHLKFDPDKHVSVTFSGICAVAWSKSLKTIDVLLVDVPKALEGTQVDRHYPMLAVPEDPKLQRKGLEPVAVVAVHGNDRDHAVWSLKDARLSLGHKVGDGPYAQGKGSVVVDDRTVAGRAPRSNASAWSSIRLLNELIELAQPKKPELVDNPPVYGVVSFRAGHLQCRVPPAAIAAKRYNFEHNGKKVFPKDRRIAIECEAIFKGPLEVTLEQGGESANMIWPEGTRATVSNGCACPPVEGVDHYLAYYKLVKATREPKLVKPDVGILTFPYTVDPCDPELVRLK